MIAFKIERGTLAINIVRKRCSQFNVRERGMKASAETVFRGDVHGSHVIAVNEAVAGREHSHKIRVHQSYKFTFG
jgi:hypothetical protein